MSGALYSRNSIVSKFLDPSVDDDDGDDDDYDDESL
jgi:hypothetical protein